jgi:hypothetical protein
MAGKVISSKEPAQYNAGENILNINLQSAPTGTYIYKLHDGEGRIMASGKILKQ